MFRKILLVAILLSISFAYTDIGYSNTAFGYAKKADAYFFDRLRADIYNQQDIGRAAIKLDLETVAGSAFIASTSFQAMKNASFNLPFSPVIKLVDNSNVYSRLYLARMSEQLLFENSSLTLGLQGVPFGVCHLWNPVDKFNPVYALSLEPDERVGIFGVEYKQYLDDLSYLQFVGNVKQGWAADKVAVSWRSFIFGGDVGLTYVGGSILQMYGLEYQANVADTGIQFSFEGSQTNDSSIGKDYFSYCTGLEYAFPWMVTLTTEYYYNGAEQISLAGSVWNSGKKYLGNTINYSHDPLTSFALTGVLALDDGSAATNAYMSRSLSDDATLDIGASVYFGTSGAEFAGTSYPKSIFLKYSSWF